MMSDLVKSLLIVQLLWLLLWSSSTEAQDFYYPTSHAPPTQEVAPHLPDWRWRGKRCLKKQEQKVFEVPEIQYGKNLGYPQFWEVRHGVWYNGPKFGPGQNGRVRSKGCGKKNCRGCISTGNLQQNCDGEDQLCHENTLQHSNPNFAVNASPPTTWLNETERRQGQRWTQPLHKFGSDVADRVYSRSISR